MNILSIIPTFEEIFDMLKKIGFSIDSLLYNGISWMYSVFMSISSARFFDSKYISAFVDRMYIIVSIVMLFLLAYSFLNVIINPDNMSKGNSTPMKLVTNVVVAIATIVLVPSIFDFAFAVQESVVEENVIGKIVLGVDDKIDVDNVDALSGNFSLALFETNFYLNDNKLKSFDLDGDGSSDYLAIKEEFSQREVTSATNANIAPMGEYLSEEYKDVLEYNWLFSTLAGIFVLYTLATFCIDMGLRVIKLLFYQVMAPVAALMNIVPGQDKILKNWVKGVLKTFLDVFIKISVIMLGVFLINLVKDFGSDFVVNFTSTNQTIINFTKFLIILGVVMFMRQATKLIEDLFGIKMEGGMLDIRKRFNESGLSAVFGGVVSSAFGARAAAAGYHARAGNLKDIKGDNKWDTFKKRSKWIKEAAKADASGLFHGSRLGMKAGWYGKPMSGIGDAYNYALDTQEAYSRIKGTGLSRSARVAAEMLRDNFGVRSYYDEQVQLVRTEYNSKLLGIDRDTRRIEGKVKEAEDYNENTFDFTNREKTSSKAMQSIDKIKSTAKSEIRKPGCPVETDCQMVVAVQSKGGSEIHYVLSNGKIRGDQLDSQRELFQKAIEAGDLVDDGTWRKGIEDAEDRLVTQWASNSQVVNMRDKEDTFKNTNGINVIGNLKSESSYQHTYTGRETAAELNVLHDKIVNSFSSDKATRDRATAALDGFIKSYQINQESTISNWDDLGHSAAIAEINSLPASSWTGLSQDQINNKKNEIFDKHRSQEQAIYQAKWKGEAQKLFVDIASDSGKVYKYNPDVVDAVTSFRDLAKDANAKLGFEVKMDSKENFYLDDSNRVAFDNIAKDTGATDVASIFKSKKFISNVQKEKNTIESQRKVDGEDTVAILKNRLISLNERRKNLDEEREAKIKSMYDLDQLKKLNETRKTYRSKHKHDK